MPETPQQRHARAAGRLRTPPVDEWDSWPFEGEIRPKALRPPGEELRRKGEGGVDVLPPTPEEVYKDNLARVAAAMDATSPS
jgi:hypothetical protein